ncbi:O-antigen ligase family protein [Confluentibacter citreus]|uniref:O-antigen ligase family protein n=1 Tax=Confluentibacter citreus TaxID=2007307 RepID=UPI0012FDBADB|nr:O-antigen ligase family protein [Confluentibacter citreus]
MSFFLASFIYILLAYINYLFNFKVWWKSFFDPETLRNSIRYIPYIELDPIYVSIFFAISVVFSFKLFFVRKKYIYVIGGLIYLCFVLLLSSKMTILSLFIITMVVIIKLFKINKMQLIITFILTFIILCCFLFYNKRLKEIIEPKTYSYRVDMNNSTNIRYALYLSSFELLERNGILGMGFTSTKNEVSNIFIGKYGGDSEYNTHNQFLSVWLATGILGIALFIYYLYFNFKLAFLKKDIIFFSVLIIIFFGLFSENLIERQFGVLLISFVISFFGFLNLYEFE